MSRRVLSALAVGAALGVGGTSLRGSTVEDGVELADVALFENRYQALADGGCALYVAAEHRPANGLSVTHRPAEYPVPVGHCLGHGVELPVFTALYEARVQFLADGGCASYVTAGSPSGEIRSPELSQSAARCTEERERGAWAVAKDFRKARP